MVLPETKYKLLRRIFSKRAKSKNGLQVPETLDNCSEDEIERAKVRRLQLALKAQQKMLIQLKKLEENPESRYDHMVAHGIFGALFTLTVLAFANLIHALFLFDSFPSDSLDVFRSVDCDGEVCTVRSYFDLKPPSILRIMFWLVFGASSLLLCIRSFVSVNTTSLLIHLFSATLFTVTWIVKREQHYASAREPL